jgi:hypothetical protein
MEVVVHEKDGGATATGTYGGIDGRASSGQDRGRVGGTSAFTRHVEEDAVEATCGCAAANGTCGGGRDAMSNARGLGSGRGGGSPMGARYVRE